MLLKIRLTQYERDAADEMLRDLSEYFGEDRPRRWPYIEDAWLHFSDEHIVLAGMLHLAERYRDSEARHNPQSTVQARLAWQGERLGAKIRDAAGMYGNSSLGI